MLSGSSSSLIIRVTRRDGDIAVATPNDSNIRLPWQPRSGAANSDIGSTADKTAVDASENELELVDIVALGARDRGEVDVEPGVAREVWLSGLDDGRCNVEGKVGVDLAVQRSGLVPCSRITARAGECDCRDLYGLCSVDSCADGAGEGDLDSDVATDVGSCESELRSGSVPELGCGGRDASLDGSDGE